MPTQRKLLQQIVRKQFKELRNNLQVKGILAELFSEGVIESDQKIKLQEVSVPKDAANKFLDDLYETVDERKFHSFICILRDSEDIYPSHLEMAGLLQQSLQEAIPQNGQNPTTRLPNGPTLQLHTVSSTDEASTQQSNSVLETSAPSSASTIGTAPNFPVETKTVPGIDNTPQTSASLIYSPEDKEPEVTQEPEQSCALDSYEHPGKDLPESDDSEEELGDEVVVNPNVQNTNRPDISDNDNDGNLLSDPFSHSEPKPPDKAANLTNSDVVSPTIEPKQFSGNSDVDASSQLVGLVCSNCYERLLSLQKEETCTNPYHQKEFLGRNNRGFSSVRERTAESVDMLCRYSPNCRKQNKCWYAHSEEELNSWKGLPTRAYLLCPTCQWKRCCDLMQVQCYDKATHIGRPKIVVYKDEGSRQLLNIRFPNNVERMIEKNEDYFSNHSLNECQKYHKDGCKFPHHKIEAAIWNAWKDKYYTEYINSRAIRKPDSFFKEVKECLKVLPTFSDVVTVPHSPKKESFPQQVKFPNRHKYVAAGIQKFDMDVQLLQAPLCSWNYKNKFSVLISSEESVHEEKLSECNGQYDLIYYNQGDIDPQHHEWYACLVMEQILADKLRQVATRVHIPFRNYEIRAQILHHKRYIRRNEACLLVGFNQIGRTHPPKLNVTVADFRRELIRNDMKIYAYFVLKHSYFWNLREAVDLLSVPIVDKLVPSEAFVLSEQTKWDNRTPATHAVDRLQWELGDQFQLDNRHQLKTCKKLLSCPPSLPFIITGPFGTGKTRVLAASAFRVLQVDRTSRVLIAAYQKRTADEYLQKYFKKNIISDLGIQAVRVLGDNAYNDGKCPFVKKPWMLQPGDLQQYRLIVTTFVTSMHMNDPGQFTHIFIDEGAQTREPECVAALRYASPDTKIVIAGDHCQVGPQTSVLGEQAYKYGLSKSLLERLHSLYNDPNGGLIEASKLYQSVLLTNWRCHSSIFQLPSTLFYGSTIKSNATDSPHPDWKYPLQFVTTSLEMGDECKWIKDGELQGAVRAEMEAMKQLVQQCADNWPTGEWGEKDLNLICVMTPTRSSERLWRSTVRNTELANVTVSVTYDIQGLEYRAVFLCTSEPVIGDFKPFDPVKSLCDPRVFNTIITRSQSLVIAFGNPFRLMKIEEQMPERDKQCWLSYFQRCWENSSIAISNSLNRPRMGCSTAALMKLEGILLKAKFNYLNDLPKLLKHPPPVDSIEMAYSKVYDAEELEENPQSPSKESYPGWKYDQDISPDCPIEVQLNKNNARVCNIIEVDVDYCIAAPVNSSGPSLGIVGPDNRRCALNGATVLVQPRDAGQGVVVAIHSQGDVNPVLCKVDPALPDYFLPVNDKKVKLLNVKDLQKLLKHHLSSEDLVNYHMQRKGYMVCFDPRAVLGRQRITHLIPMDAAGRFLFLVQPLSWDVKERYPRGAAIAIIPKGTALPLAESLLQIAHQDGFQEDLDPSIQKTEDAKDRSSLCKFVPQSMPAPDAGLCSSAIGILESADDFSICAFSVEHRQDCFSIKVHIANVVENMELLEQGHKKDLSVPKNSFMQGPPARGGLEDVYGGGSIKPNAITLEFNLEITLKENTKILSQVQDKGTLVGRADRGTLVRQAGNTVDITNLKIGFSESFVSCNYFLSISDLDDMLRGVISGPASRKKISKKLTLHDQIAILYIVAQNLHRRRLGHDEYSLFEATSTEYPEVHELFKEFLIHFNHEAAVKLKDSFPDRALLRRVNPHPGREWKLKSIQEDILQIHTYSDTSTSSSSTSQDLLLFPSVVSEVIESLKHLDGVRVKESLCQLYHHPQYIFLLSRLREFLSVEELCVLDNSIAVHSEVTEHYVHKLPLYTSLTSPHQCVADLYVQEGLLAALRETEWKRSAEELITVANQSNKAKSKVKFKCLQRNLLLAASAQQSSICVRAIVQKSQEGSLRYCYFQPDSATANVSQVESFFMPERNTSVRMRVLSSQGLPLQSFKQVVDSSSNLPSFGFFVAEDDCSGFSRVLVTGVSPPSTLRLSKHTLCNLNECIHSTADSRRLIEKLERMLTPGDQQNPPILFAALEVPFPTATDHSFQIVRLWLGCDPTSHVLSLQPQCMELSSGVKVCLQHMRDPLSCFTQDPPERASKLPYNSIDEYRALWSKAILAVSAEHAVNSCTSSLVYKDVVLAFSKFIIPPKVLTPEMYVPVGEITAMFKENCVTFPSRLYVIGEGDLVCVRYEVDLNQESLRDLLEKYRKHIHPTTCTVARAVLHMVVKKVTLLDKATQVSFEVAGTQPSVSPLMKEILQKNQLACEIEVISMSPTLRKPYRLLQGSTVRQGLPFDIAMGVFRKIHRHTGRGKGLPRKQPVFVSSMSIADRDILESAMNNSLQLIQAVPGTGGEMIANTLVCSFALSNKEQRGVEYTQGRSLQKCVLYCFPNEEMAHQAASALYKWVCNCTSDDIHVLYINRQRERHVHYDEDHVIFDERPPNYDSGDDSDSKEYALHSLLRTSSSAPRINEMERKLTDCCQKKMIPAIKDQGTYASLLLKAEGEIIGHRSFDIVICTASEASSERIRRYFQPVQVVVYNASMITEPETFSAIHQASHVVLIGDHHQHRPLLNSDVSVQNGMNVSLYERLYKLIERENDGDVNKCPLFTHLKEQIDMLPPICELVSHLFYKDQLQSSKNLTFKQDHQLQSFWPNGFPVVLCNMAPAVGRKESLIVDDNTTDNVEIQKTIQVVGALQSCMTDYATSVVVITYSTAQKLHMERLLNSSQPQCHKAPGTVPVLTVDECIAQDRRYDVAILSTVTSELNMHSVKAAINSGETIRKQGLETLGDPNRLCAAISISRQGLIILGNADLLSMKTLTNSEVWEGLVLYCQTKRCILGRDEFPLSKPIPSEALQKSTLPSASKSSSSNVAEQRPSPPPPVRQPVSSATPRKKGKKGKGKK